MFKIKDWKKHQHYAHRNPPWIKLHKSLLNDPEWFSLDPEAAKVLIMLWLIASETDGELPASNVLAFRLHLASKKLESIIKDQLSHWIIWDASNVLAECLQDASTETETELSKERKKGGVGVDVLVLPDWMPQDEWNEWLSGRKKASNKPSALGKAIESLSTWRDEGYCPKEILNTSIMNGWQGIFKPKSKPSMQPVKRKRPSL